MDAIIAVLVILGVSLLLIGVYMISYQMLFERQMLGRMLIALGVVYSYMALRFSMIWN